MGEQLKCSTMDSESCKQLSKSKKTARLQYKRDQHGF